MTSFTCEVTIGRPVDAVYSYVNEPSNNVKWQTSTVEVRRQTEGPLENPDSAEFGVWAGTTPRERRGLRSSPAA